LFNGNPQYRLPSTERKEISGVRKIVATWWGGDTRINDRTEVLDGKNRVIPGLYAAGYDAGGMYADSYAVWLPGGSLGFALNSGRTAGENAMKYIKTFA
jgi:fumarate reductase flavoprotein subunit